MKNQTVAKFQDDPHRLTVVLAAAFLIKTVLLVLATGKVINADCLLYYTASRQFAEGNIQAALRAFQMPLFPAVIAFVHTIIPDWTLAGRLVSALSLVLVNIPLFRITQALFSRKAAFWACMAFTVAPVGNEWSIMIIRDPLFLLLLSCAMMFAILSLQRQKTIDFAMTFLFAALALLCRSEGIVFIVIYLLCLFFWVIRYPQERQHFARGLLIWGAFFALILAGVLINRSSSAAAGSAIRFGYIQGLINSVFQLEFLDRYLQIYAYLKGLEGAGPFYDYGKGFLETARHYLFLIYLISVLETVLKIVWPFFCIPLLWAWKCPKGRALYFLYLVFAAYLLSTYLFLVMHDYMASRYAWVPAFLLYPLIGLGMTRLLDKLKKTKGPGVWGLVLCVALFIPPAAKSVVQVSDGKTAIIEAGRWLASRNLPQSATVATMEARVVYYAGWDIYADAILSKDSQRRFYHPADMDGLKRVIPEKRPDLLVVKAHKTRPGEAFKPEGYRKVHSFDDQKYTITIFFADRFQPAAPLVQSVEN